ncbi:MAG: cell division protein SepF [Ruminococcaceae bacterium]|nr:cell division protein SepF [Oscillospiraceae bacterium]
MNIKEKIEKIFYGSDNQDYVGDIEENDDDFYGAENVTETPDRPARPSNVSVSTGASIEMKVVKPDSIEAVTQIANQLLDRKTILLNLEDTNKETARRLIDFLNGVAYAISGNLKKVANCTYVITPSNVDVSGDQLKETRDFE